MPDTEQPVRVQNAPVDAFPGLKTELQRTWELLKAKILIFILICLIGSVAMALANGAWLALCIFLMPRVPPIVLLLLPVLALPLIILPMIWMMTASLFALKESVHTVMEATRAALPKLLGMLWIWLLFVIMVNGGFLLLFVPGVLLSVWFFFVWHVFMEENCTGVNALVQSREYVRGRFFPVLLRLLAVGILCSIVIVVGGIAIFIPIVGPILTSFVALFAGLFFFIYGYVLYQDLRLRPDTTKVDTLSRNDKIKTLAPGLAAGAILLIFTVGSAYTLAQKIPIMQTIKMIQSPIPGTGIAFKDILFGKPLTGKSGQIVLEKTMEKVMTEAMTKGMKEFEKQMQASGKEMSPQMKKMLEAMKKPKPSAGAVKPSTPPEVPKPPAAAADWTLTARVIAIVDELYLGNLRDPFIIGGGGGARTQAQTATAALESVPFSIHDMELTGIMKDSRGKQALLKNRNTGASYMLVRNKLLDSKGKPVPGVSGVIHGKQEVTLMTEDTDRQPLSLHEKEE